MDDLIKDQSYGVGRYVASVRELHALARPRPSRSTEDPSRPPPSGLGFVRRWDDFRGFQGQPKSGSVPRCVVTCEGEGVIFGGIEVGI